MAERKAIEATIRAYAAAWGAHDRAQWVSTFAEEATQEDPVGSPVRRGRAEIGDFWDRAVSAYVSIEIIARDIFIVSHEAAMAWTLRATTASGELTLSGVDVFTFNDNALIASVRAYWDHG